MALEMREHCETCAKALGQDEKAYICSYECTYCHDCWSGHAACCPNCGGELVLRPRRVVTATGPGQGS